MRLNPLDAVLMDDGNMLVKLPNNTPSKEYFVNGKLSTQRIVITEDDIITFVEKESSKTIYIHKETGVIILPDEYQKILDDIAKKHGMFEDNYDNYYHPNLDIEYQYKKEERDAKESWKRSTSEPKQSEPVKITPKWNIIGCIITTGSPYITSSLSSTFKAKNFLTIDIMQARAAMLQHYAQMEEYKDFNFNIKDARFAKIQGKYIDTQDRKSLYSNDLKDAKKILKDSLHAYEMKILSHLISFKDATDKDNIDTILRNIQTRLVKIEYKQKSRDSYYELIQYIAGNIKAVNQDRIEFTKDISQIDKILKYD